MTWHSQSGLPDSPPSRIAEGLKIAYEGSKIKERPGFFRAFSVSRLGAATPAYWPRGEAPAAQVAAVVP